MNQAIILSECIYEFCNDFCYEIDKNCFAKVEMLFLYLSCNNQLPSQIPRTNNQILKLMEHLHHTLIALPIFSIFTKSNSSHKS